MTTACSNRYQLRGQRVEYLTDMQIFNSVEAILKPLGLDTPLFPDKIENLFDLWAEQFGLTIDIVEDDEWPSCTNGHYDPSTLTIRIPTRILKLIKSKNAKQRKKGLRVLFHELGHFCLAHKAVLHDSYGNDCKEVDSEEQADLFSDYMAVCIDNLRSKQGVLF
ncbi:ImmA/IrrE family metallo-endopeptidase [Advenella sp. EE-W14]|uniref:ImmA/IrrE family metallo-endopeptidase n=1 Tax=Advenella sp. EE-W14 TaxID=2722705 RepID=UPI00145D4556|nr:ImmA/IrrE family metallo-endopeptidase [Advenella sp. EE-W14]